jgi:hypothetical protein
MQYPPSFSGLIQAIKSRRVRANQAYSSLFKVGKMDSFMTQNCRKQPRPAMASAAPQTRPSVGQNGTVRCLSVFANGVVTERGPANDEEVDRLSIAIGRRIPAEMPVQPCGRDDSICLLVQIDILRWRGYCVCR